MDFSSRAEFCFMASIDSKRCHEGAILVLGRGKSRREQIQRIWWLLKHVR
ncbi:Hypothetical protein FKW44_010576 [Caligus rogercresseyi]|uniref:Uncharacterized protein n=1 Tax=Caligus rogercresseyi TaxID=217165 RepID=A0A7T8HGS5_CALRO|nr:Hypothetical protein FKW44_010576 [Caligus rogercresseyi]